MLASGDDVKDYPTGTYLLPETVLLKSEERTRMLLQSANGAMETYYTSAAELLAAIASETGRFTVLSASEAEARWQSVCDLPACLYVSYHSDLPLQIVGYFAAALTENSLCVEDAAPILVKELVFYSDAENGCRALVRASNGTVYSCSTWSDPEYMADLYAYSVYEMEKLAETDSAFGAAAFSGAYFDNEPIFSSPTTPVLLTGLNAPKFRFSVPSLSLMLTNKTDTNAFLRLFAYNPNKINRHEEATGATVYVEDHGMLKISDASVSYTAAQNGGMSASEELGTDASGIDLYDAILYSTRVLDGLRTIRFAYFGGDCELILDSVAAVDGQAEIRFRYYADNLELRGQSCEVVFVFDSDILVSARIDGFTGYNVSDADQLYSGGWVAERFYSSLGTVEHLYVVYDYHTNSSVSAQWIAVAENEEGDS